MERNPGRGEQPETRIRAPGQRHNNSPNSRGRGALGSEESGEDARLFAAGAPPWPPRRSRRARRRPVPADSDRHPRLHPALARGSPAAPAPGSGGRRAGRDGAEEADRFCVTTRTVGLIRSLDFAYSLLLIYRGWPLCLSLQRARLSGLKCL